MDDTPEEIASLRKRSADARAEAERKRAMVEWLADVRAEVRAGSPREARDLIARTLYAHLRQAATDAGDLLHVAEKQNRWMSGAFEAGGRPGYLLFDGSLRFVSDSDSWDEASSWLRQVLDRYRNEDVVVLGVEQYRGCWD